MYIDGEFKQSTPISLNRNIFKNAGLWVSDPDYDSADVLLKNLQYYELVKPSTIQCLDTNCKSCYCSGESCTCSNGICNLCKDQYRLNVIDLCDPCDVSNCKNCDTDITVCDICMEGYRLNASKLQCDLCEVSNCSNCDADITKCSECKDTFFFYQVGLQDKCETICPDGLGTSAITKICENCQISNCKKCDTDQTICTDCKDGFKLAANQLVCDACISHCKNCDSDLFKCDECFDNYFLWASQDTCNSDCPSTYAKVQSLKKCESCQIENCDKCTNNLSICDSCVSPFLLTRDSNICSLQCQSGYSEFEVQRICKACQVDLCQKCQNDNTKLCQSCNLGLVLSSDQKSCHKSCPVGYYKQSNEEKCVQRCEENEYPDEDTHSCQTCNKSLSNCQKCSNKDICMECKAGYQKLNYLDQTICILNCSPKYYDIEMQKCNYCNTGYIPNSNLYICEKCSIKFGQGCVNCVVNKCLKCQGNLLLNAIENQCQDTCSDGFMENTDLKICQPCSEYTNILECTLCNKDKVCLECQENYFLDENLNQCLESPKQCSVKFIGIIEEINKGKCISSCPSFYFLNSIENLCQQCHESCEPGQCLNSTDSKSCLKCKEKETYIFVQERQSLAGSCHQRQQIKQDLTVNNYSQNLQLIYSMNSTIPEFINSIKEGSYQQYLSLSISNPNLKDIQFSMIPTNDSLKYLIKPQINKSDLPSNQLLELTIVNSYKDATTGYEITNPSIICEASIKDFKFCDHNEIWKEELNSCIQNKNTINISKIDTLETNKFILKFEESQNFNETLLKFLFENPSKFITINLNSSSNLQKYIFNSNLEDKTITIILNLQQNIQESLKFNVVFSQFNQSSNELIVFQPKRIDHSIKFYQYLTQSQISSIQNQKQLQTNIIQNIKWFSLTVAQFGKYSGVIALYYLLIIGQIETFKYINMEYPSQTKMNVFQAIKRFPGSEFFNISSNNKNEKIPLAFTKFENNLSFLKQTSNYLCEISICFIMGIVLQFVSKYLQVNYKQMNDSVQNLLKIIRLKIINYFCFKLLLIIIVACFTQLLFIGFLNLIYSSMNTSFNILNMILSLLFIILSANFIFFSFVIILMSNEKIQNAVQRKQFSPSKFFTLIILKCKSIGIDNTFIEKFRILFRTQDIFSKFKRYIIVYELLVIILIILFIIILKNHCMLMTFLILSCLIIFYLCLIFLKGFKIKFMMFTILFLHFLYLIINAFFVWLAYLLSSQKININGLNSLSDLIYYSILNLSIFSGIFLIFAIIYEVKKNRNRSQKNIKNQVKASTNKMKFSKKGQKGKEKLNIKKYTQ